MRGANIRALFSIWHRGLFIALTHTLSFQGGSEFRFHDRLSVPQRPHGQHGQSQQRNGTQPFMSPAPRGASCSNSKPEREIETVSFFKRKALIVLFQRWFSVAAEETSVGGDLAAYLREVRKSTPTLLAFLVNLADDNGNTVLHYSVSHCNYSIVGLLLETGDAELSSPERSSHRPMLKFYFDPFRRMRR